MRQFLQAVLRKPVLWLSNKFDSKPDKTRIYDALSVLYNHINSQPGKNGISLSLSDYGGKFIIFSDQHKGRRNGADDFMNAESNYLAALAHYYEQGFFFINLGDCEELWENTLAQVKKYNKAVIEAEKKFLNDNRYLKIFGNHDLYWNNDPLAPIELENMFGCKLKVYEGVILEGMINGRSLQIFCTHGHQGDKRSDGNWFTKFFISRIWAPLQAYLRINTNEPSNNDYKKTVHNEIMYEWSATQNNIVLITGHTHQPVFESLTHIERLHRQYIAGKSRHDEDLIHKIEAETQTYRHRFDLLSSDYSNILPTYFNSGCCCFLDGDITGIEIDNGYIRLIKWESTGGKSLRTVLEEEKLENIVSDIAS